MSHKLLVIDDEIELMLALVRLARHRGYDATGTIDPSDALERVRHIRPHVVLLDLRMPRIDGRDLLPRIVAEPSAPRVIVMSGWIDELTDELCRSYGACAVLRKPVDIDELFRRVDSAARPQ